MKTFIIIILSSLHLFSGCKSQPAANILLSRIEKNNRDINSITYTSVHEQINPNVSDSIFKVVGKVWLMPDHRDSIFGSAFHVQGMDRAGSFDYYYDGTKSYEIRHDKKTIEIIDPYKYENNANNPAKTRTALFPLVHELSDTNLSETLTKNNPVIELKENKGTYIMTLTYPENEYDQTLTLIISINKNPLSIGKIRKHIEWRGVVFKTLIEIDSIQTNKLSIPDEILLQNTYQGYAINEFERGNKQQSTYSYAGLKAKNFKYPTFNKSLLDLESLKGKFVLLDFWETWCGYCILELPEIQKLQDKYKDDLVVVGISTENKPQVERLLQKNKITYINIYADQQILQDYKVSGRPTHFLLDRNGTIISQSEGNLASIRTVLVENATHTIRTGE